MLKRIYSFVVDVSLVLDSDQVLLSLVSGVPHVPHPVYTLPPVNRKQYLPKPVVNLRLVWLQGVVVVVTVPRYCGYSDLLL